MRGGIHSPIFLLLFTLCSCTYLSEDIRAQTSTSAISAQNSSSGQYGSSSEKLATLEPDYIPLVDRPHFNEPFSQRIDYNRLSETTLTQTVGNVPPAVLTVPDDTPRKSRQPVDLWARIVDDYQLDVDTHPSVQPYIRWYARKQSYLDRVADRARPYLYDIVTEIESRNMPGEIALLPIVESAFQPFAYSPGRAAGIWQFIPATGRHFGLKQNWWYDGRRDVYRSTRAALDYLQQLHQQFEGDWLLALAAYNTGAYNVTRAIRKNRKKGKPTDFWSLSLPAETRGYVPKLLAIAYVLKHADKVGVHFNPIPNQPYWKTVKLDSQLDLAKAAEFAGVSIEEIYRLNPGLNRWATPPGAFELLLPADRISAFKEKLEKTPSSMRLSWKRHVIKRGESLGLIAKKYHTSISQLKELNQLRSNRIRAGHALIVPVAAKSMQQYTLSEIQRKLDLLNRPANSQRFKIIHTVKSGDSLWEIARTHHVKVETLARWNNFSPRDPLRIGQKLIIWKKYSAKQTGANHLVNQRIRKVTYTVRKGDSLARISKNFKIGVAQIKSWNRIGKYIHPGQKLTLFVDVTRQSES
ncbi:MAG: LysM peptidoglycan-binding domain-containing protein [Gammaproteobacteria bacterium]|nr:MAG: LysM peptidoglycan-binding domain-containing protein [Gammaproteobacteria bacterium]